MNPPPATAERPAPQQRCIAVHVGDALYGVPLEEVQEVIGMRPLTRVFHAPEVIAGVTSLRGDVLPVLNLGALLGSAPSGFGRDARIVVVREAAGARRRAGLSVDGLAGLRDVPTAGLAPTPHTMLELARQVVTGVIPAPPPCAVLSVTALLESPDVARMSVGDP